MSSIRRFLIIATLSTMILVGFVAALQGYRAGMTEAERLSDSQLLEMAQLLANLNTELLSSPDQPGHIAYQLWKIQDQGAPRLLHSDNIPAQAVTSLSPGFDFANFGGYRWRTHVYMTSSGDRLVVAATRTDIRYQLAENVILETIFPMLLGLPISGLLIWFIIGRGLTPLRELSAKLQEKQHRDLSPVSLDDPPQELTPVVQAINGLLHRLARAFEFEKRFTADAAHELRTPISALKLQLHNLQQRQPETSEEFTELAHGIQRMQHLVEQILALYRSTPEQISANFISLDLSTLVENVIAENYPLFESRHQNIEFKSDANAINTVITGDRFALTALIVNLLSNASKYTQERGHIIVSLSRDSEGLHLCVEDNGPGISNSQREAVFRRFHRLGETSQSSTAIGCGLGLAIVHNIASLHGATVKIRESRFSSGTCFDLCFPGEKA